MSDLTLPQSWKLESLRSNCLKTSLVNPEKQPEIPFVYVDVSSVSNESFRIIETKTLLGKEAPSRAKKRIRTDDIIFATVRPTLRRIALIPRELDDQVCSTGYCVVRPDKNKLEPAFAYFWLLTENIAKRVEYLQKGATYPAISDSDLLDECLPLPPLPEQRTIAATLRAVQDAREARRRELTLERERKAALMEDLFTCGSRGEPCKQTEFGKMPQSWEVVPLGKAICNGPQNGLYKHMREYGEGTYIIRITEFDNDGLFFAHGLNRVRLTPAEVQKYRVQKDDILINRVNSLSHLGKCTLVPELPEATVFESNMMRFSVNSACLLPQYLIRFLVTDRCRERIRRMAKRAVAQSSINQGDVCALSIPQPEPSEQQDIAEILTACDQKIAALKAEAALHDELFRALLEELMTARLLTLPLLPKTV
jgi:type I restriction enzyme S subunit